MVTQIDISSPEQVLKEYLELNERFKYMLWIPVEDGYCIEGTLSASVNYSGVALEVKYQVRIEIPRDYPHSIPICYEVGNRIDQYYHQYQNGKLCLGIDTNQYFKFRANQNLLGFVNDLLLPYLFGYEYYLTYGEPPPWSEERHNAPGLVDYYIGFFENIRNISQLLYLLVHTILMRNVYLPNNPCPCGSGKHIRFCHKDKVLQLRKLCINYTLFRDVCIIINHILLDPTMVSNDEASKVIALKSFIEKNCTS